MELTNRQIGEIVSIASKKLAEYCIEADIHHTVTGVSGGLDSAVTLALSQKACEYAYTKGYSLKSIGLILPCHSDPYDAVLAKRVIKKFGAELIEIDLSGVFDKIEKGMLHPLAEELVQYHHEAKSMRYRTSQGNVKARLRMALGTYYTANMVNGLVLSTDNYSEYWMGFWTLHGDVGDYGMIQELWKGDELTQLARYLEVPEDVIMAVPKDGLGILDGGDEEQLGASYKVVDRILKELLKNGIDLNGPISQLDSLPKIEGVENSLVRKIAERAIRNAFKRKSPVIITRKELGLGSY